MTTQPIKLRTRHHLRVENVTLLKTALLKMSLLITACVSSTTALACDDWLAKTIAISGAVERSTQNGDWQQLQNDQPLCPGDHIRVADNSRASLYLRNNTYMRLQENSVLHFPAPKDNTSYWLEVTEGVAHFISRIVNRFEVNTPYVNAVVEGTEFTVSATTVKASVTVIEGQVKTSNASGTLMVDAGQQVSATSRNGALTRLAVPASKTVEWAIYYPPVLTIDSLTSSNADEQQQLTALLPLLQQNRPDLALKLLEQNGVTSPAHGIAHAALLLAVGDAAQFDARITPLLDGPQSAHAWSLKAIADAARNQPDAALTAARRAVERAPDLAAAHIAHSYAQQSALQLNDALASAERATEVEPKNSLAWLRVSELHLMLGDIDAASASLAQAESQPHALPSVQAQVSTARGFIHLFRLNLQAAHQSFTHAQTLDASDPQSHLGLGLAKLRDGDLENGRQQLEYAVSMDPMRSLLRSYLGRAYFEEKRDNEAFTQWQLASQLDPNDPTPHFYSGVQKLFANDPIGATSDLETAKKLNNARAVYRGETLLESDAASRSATLARAYNETGYEQGVLLNGWEAIRRDPTNAEGHRLLADHYAKDSRFESARASALLQSQLWQPLTAYNLQPQLSETGISVVEGSGPQRPAFNEYHSLFMQEGAYGMANGFGGSDSTWGNDLGGSLLAGPFAVSLGQYHYESNGWRENADQEQDVYNGFMQWQVTPSTSVQAEHRELRWDKGYLAPTLRIEENASSSEEQQRTTDRVGLHHRVSAGNAFVVSVIKQSLTIDSLLSQDIGATDSKLEAESVSTEAQWQIQAGKHQLLLGGSLFDTEADDTLEQSILADLDGLMYEIMINRKTEETPETKLGYAEYFYALNSSIDIGLGIDHYTVNNDIHTEETQVELVEGFEIGTSSEALDTPQDERTRWRPRAGATFALSPSVQFRSAYFTSFARSTIVDQSIAPTQFFGFINNYDDIEGTEAKNYALATDVAIDTLRYGVSIISRRLRSPYEGVGTLEFVDQKQYLTELYLNSTPTNRLAVSINASWSNKQFNSRSLLATSLTEINQYRFPLRLMLYGSEPISFVAEQVYYIQDTVTANNLTNERDNSWITNAYMQYRFGKHLGSMTFGVENAANKKDVFLSFSERELAFYPARFWYTAININF